MLCLLRKYIQLLIHYTMSPELTLFLISYSYDEAALTDSRKEEVYVHLLVKQGWQFLSTHEKNALIGAKNNSDSKGFI